MIPHNAPIGKTIRLSDHRTVRELRSEIADLRAFLTGDPHGTVSDVDEEVLDDELVDFEDVVCSTSINVDGVSVEAHHGMTAGEARALGCLLLHSARTLEQIEAGE